MNLTHPTLESISKPTENGENHEDEFDFVSFVAGARPESRFIVGLIIQNISIPPINFLCNFSQNQMKSFRWVSAEIAFIQKIQTNPTVWLRAKSNYRGIVKTPHRKRFDGRIEPIRMNKMRR